MASVQGGGLTDWETVAISLVVGVVDGGPCDGEAPGDPLQRPKHSLDVRPCGGPVEEASYEDVL